MAGLSDLSFDPGINFASLVSTRFGCPVSPPKASSPSAFHLVVSFGRSAIRLNEVSVAMILQSCLGGVAKNFNVFFLSGWMFSFCVSCKQVGFMVYNLKSFACKSFSVFFHLWGNGGPNWRKDYDLWLREQEAEWTVVGSKSKKSYAQVVRTPPVNKKSTFLRLKFPDNYCHNYVDSQSSVKPRRNAPSPTRDP